MVTQHKADVLIIGAGLVGAAQALALAQQGITSIVVDKAVPDDVLAGANDGRVSAISHASVLVLQSLGVWSELAAEAGPIDKILVREGGQFSDVTFDTAETGSEPFGYMVPNRLLRRVLLQVILDHEQVTCLCGDTVASLERHHTVQAVLTSGDTAEASLLVVADGRYSSVREMVGVKARRFEYGQNALVCTIRHERPHENTATEWFFPQGPLAILPMQGGQHACIVWTEETAMAEHLAALEPDIFLEELQRKLNGSIGDIALESRVYTYPLNLFQAEAYIADRTAIIGDAAHAIHPIAGQGVNLGYRDVAVLTELLVEACRNGQDMGGSMTLERYQRWRRFDATSMIAVTDGLNRLFSNRSSAARVLRRTGMRLFNKTLPVKFFFMDAAMGMAGDLPKMLRGEALQ